ncbi:MAG: aminopeptidase P family protein [Clostridia bacterium]|nr:aminopeptidase P family protein [Clostridia bacterium]
MIDRCNRLVALATEKEIDAIIVTSPINYQYFSGFTGSNAILLITKERRILYTDFRYTIQANIQTKGEFEVVEVSRLIGMDMIRDELKRIGARRVGFEDATITVRRFKTFETLEVTLVPFYNEMTEIRMYKSPYEIEQIIAAQNAADAAFKQLLGIIKPGMREVEVAVELEYLMKKNGADDKSFDTIVGSGENGALCHAVPGQRRLTYGDLVVLDFGARINGYCSDMTRTIAIGEPCDKLKEIYKIVLDAHFMALDALKPGITGGELDAIARDHIAAHGYGDCFGHSLGHGFGLEVHESPAAAKGNETILRPGMTITVEPGIYIEGLGGVRIEDCCIVTEDGYIDPVTAPKHLIIIE